MFVISTYESRQGIFYVNLAFAFLSVLRGHSVFSSPPQRPMTSDFEGFLYQILSITLFSYLNSWERASIFPFQCWVLNKGTTGTSFITSLVWRGPWLGIEPGTSRTRGSKTVNYSLLRTHAFKEVSTYSPITLEILTTISCTKSSSLPPSGNLDGAV